MAPARNLRGAPRRGATGRSRAQPRGIMTSAVGATMGKEMEAAVGELRKTQEALQKLMDGRAALQTQSHENEMVKAVRALLLLLPVAPPARSVLMSAAPQEFSLLEDDASVFKLVGPVLVKQDLQEARANVDKRLEYIKEELGRMDSHTKETEKKMEAQRGVVMQMQAKSQAAKQGAQ